MKKEIKQLENLTGKKVILKEFIGGGYGMGFKPNTEYQAELEEGPKISANDYDDSEDDFIDLMDRFDEKSLQMVIDLEKKISSLWRGNIGNPNDKKMIKNSVRKHIRHLQALLANYAQ